MKSEGEVKVAKSAWDKTSLECGTCTAAHGRGWGGALPRCVVEQGVRWRMWSQLSCALQLRGWSCLRDTPPLLPSSPGVEFCHSRTPHVRCLLPLRQQWGIYVCRCWKPKYFQNRCPFVGFPIYRLLEDGAITFDCLIKCLLGLQHLLLSSSHCYVRWLLRQLTLSPTVRFWKGLSL